MAVVVDMQWEGVNEQQYDALREVVDWEHDVPVGAIYHVASFDEGCAYVTDVWAAAEDFERFVEESLMPQVLRLGIPGEPQVNIRPVHAVFAPGYEVRVPEQRPRRLKVRT
jgi:hypothetical protein